VANDAFTDVEAAKSNHAMTNSLRNRTQMYDQYEAKHRR
jgi:hypothetical protein